MYIPLHLKNFTKEKLYYFSGFFTRFMVQGEKQIKEVLPGNDSYTLDNDEAQLRLLKIIKKPSIFRPYGVVEVEKEEVTFGRAYTPSEILVIFLSFAAWALPPFGVLGVAMGLWAAYRMTSLLMSSLSATQKIIKGVQYHVTIALIVIAVYVGAFLMIKYGWISL